MSHTPYRKAVYQSFYSADLYREVARKWQGEGIRYLAFLSALITAIIIMMWIIFVSLVDPKGFAEKWEDVLFEYGDLNFEQGINRIFNTVSQIPPLSIVDNRLQSDASQPHFIYNPKVRNAPRYQAPNYVPTPLIIIDTTGNTTSLQDTTAMLLLTDRAVITRSDDGSDHIAYFSNNQFDQDGANQLLDILAHIPNIRLKDGTVSIDEPQPYFINHPETSDPIAVIDTTGQYMYPEDTSALLLLTKDTLFVKHLLSDTYTEIYLADADTYMVAQLIETALGSFKTFLFGVLILLVLPLMFGGLLALMIITALIYSLIGMFFVSSLKVSNMAFGDIMRTASVTLTPIFFINALLPRVLEHQGVVYFLVSMGYLFFAIKSNAEEQR